MDTNEAHSRDVECSNMGTCDRVTGTCQCRDGFEGQACERGEYMVVRSRSLECGMTRHTFSPESSPPDQVSGKEAME